MQGLFILKLVWKKEKLLSMDNVFLISQECSKIEVIGKGNVVDNKDFLSALFNSMYDELPAPKSMNKK